jgi:DNA invertase Pin-like site-specific DNA recombinase
MKRGYARVSTDEQNLDLQTDALTKAGCEVIYSDNGVSGLSRSRPELSRLLADLEAGDHVVVWKLDRLGRSLQHLIQLINDFKDQGVDFSSITDSIDTSTAGGRLTFHVMGAMAEFESAIISERTKAGMSAAKQRGKHLGRPGKMTTEHVQQALKWIEEGKPKRTIARLLKVSPATLYRHLQASNDH